MPSFALIALLLPSLGFGHVFASEGSAPQGQSSASQGQGSATPGITMHGTPSAGPCSYSGSHTATIRLTVTPSGQAADEAIAVSSGNSCLDRQALKTVAGYHFNAAMRDGHAVATRIQIQVNYKRF